MRRAAFLTLLAALALTGCGQSDRAELESPPDGIVAHVGAGVVTFAELQAYMTEIRRTFEAQERAFPTESTPEFANLEAQAIERLVKRAKENQVAAELGVSAPLEEVEREFAGIDQADLRKYGVTAERVHEELGWHLLENEIFKTVVASALITDDDVRSYYEENIETYTHRAPRQALFLWVRSEALAHQLHDRIAAGEDFLTLAAENEDPEPSVTNGRRTFTDSGPHEGYENAVFSLSVGELSEPIKAGIGWSLVEPVSPLDPGRVVSLAEAADTIRIALRTRRNHDVMNAWQKDVNARFAPVYADGYDPAGLRTEIPYGRPPGPQKDASNCDLPNGTYTYDRLVALGCAGGFPIPGVDGPLCPERLPGDGFTGGFSSEEVDSGWADFLMDTSGTCVDDPQRAGNIVEIGGPRLSLMPEPSPTGN